MDAGSHLAAQAGQTMQQIVGEISSASREQTAGIEQINEAIAQMDRATQRNAALVEQASAAALSLRQQSESLVKAVATFDVAA